MKILLTLLAVVALTACSRPVPTSGPDQCLRAQIFDSCLANVPKGPTVAGRYNDWDEVVKECASQAYWASMRLREAIKLECRGE